jgi:RND family efflux transporter MFP subunit
MSTTGTGKARRGGFGIMTALALGVGLFAFIGLRVKETLGDRVALAATLAEQTKAGPRRAATIVAHGTPRAWHPRIPVTGTLAPVQDADIGFKTTGRLSSVRVKVGDQVKAGQQLAALDVSEASAQAAATSAGVRAAQVSYDMAKDAEKRTAALFEQHAVSDAEHLAALNRSALTLAQLEQARAQARLASVGVGNGSLAAPFSGLITRAPSGVGKIVGMGEPLFHLEDTSVLKLSATLTESDARLVEVGAAIEIEDASSRGQVTAVLGSLDPQTRRVPMIAEIPNTGSPPLLAGAFVRATVVSNREAQVLSLPAGSLRAGSQDEVVVLSAGKAHLVRISFTAAEDGSLLVRSGITAADAVVQSPSPEVHEGDDLGPANP